MEINSNQAARWRARILLLTIASIALAYGSTKGYQYWRAARRESFFERCSRAQKEKNWPLLREAAQEWRNWDTHSADALVFLADASQQTGDFASAVKFLREVPDDDPKALSAYLAAMKLQFGPLNRPLDGVETCKRILEIEPLTTEAHAGLIEFYVVTLQHNKLIRQIREAIELQRESPADYAYLFLVDTLRVGDASAMNSVWLISDPDSELFLVAKALQMPEPGAEADVQNKYEVVDRLLERFPDNIELLAYKIDVKIGQGDVDGVIALLKQVTEDADRDNRFWRYKGWLHLMRHQHPEAREALERALQLHPMDWNARNWLADLVRREGKLKEAAELENLVRQARQIREDINARESVRDLPREILLELEDHAGKCGDKQVAGALRRRLER